LAVAAKKTTKKPTKKAAKKRARRPAAPRLPFCYTADLVDALGVSRKTLHKYVQLRLLPAPVRVSDGKQGVRSRWTLIALDHAAFILEQQDIGHTLTEIAAMIAARWGTQDKLPLKEDAPKSAEPGSGPTP
jgi:hypothetical protein